MNIDLQRNAKNRKIFYMGTQCKFSLETRLGTKNVYREDPTQRIIKSDQADEFLLNWRPQTVDSHCAKWIPSSEIGIVEPVRQQLYSPSCRLPL